MYPAGYGGTFINWSINASDADTAKNTVKNPISPDVSKKTGGVGTAHLHVKLPTHNGVMGQVAWILYNKPTEKQVYSCYSSSVINEIAFIRQFDPDGIFIVIHNNNDPLQHSFGAINSIIKWPTHLSSFLAKKSELGSTVVHPNFDPYNCADDREFRNWAIRRIHWQYLVGQAPIDQAELKSVIDSDERWYHNRSSAQPHEVNDRFYNTDFSYAHRIFEIDLKTLFSHKFISWFENFMQASNVSTDYNLDQVKTISSEYLKIQKTLQWFESMDNWKKTGKFDSFISSHSIIEAEAIRHMIRLKPELDYNTDSGAPASDWDVLSAQEISDRYFTSDDFK